MLGVVVVIGMTDVTNGDNILCLTENQSTYIPLETEQRPVNPGKTSLEIIEAWSVDCRGEGNIVWFECAYDRIN